MDETPDRDRTLVRHDDELWVGTERVEGDTVRAHKHVETTAYDEVVPRERENAEVERIPAVEGDSGEIETLPDGAVSIPLLEEEIVVTKRTVVRERVIVRKRIVVEEQRVQADLRREHVELDVDEPHS